MPNFIDNLGLGFIYDDNETTTNFFGHLVQNGKAITGYYGCPNLFNSKGDIDFFVKTRLNDEGNLEVAGLDTHCCGRNIWELRNTGMDITPKDSLLTERLFMFKNHADGSGMLPIHIINADVLPSFLEDDVVSMQMCAFPLDINYYADEDDYADHQPKTDDGKHWLISDGSLMALSFLHNHQMHNEGDEDVDYSTDDHVLFRGTVKRLNNGVLEMHEGEKINTYIRCVIDTPYGELHFAHTIDQIEEEQRENLKVGAVVFGTCVLSGDVAIREYDQGIIKDFDNNFKLLRQVLVKGQAERMRPVLSEDAVYISEASKKSYEGIEKIVDRFNYVHEEQSSKTFATPATIVSVDSEDLEYPVGTRCLLISYETEDNYSAIAFLDVNEEGNITRIYITTDSRYHFREDEKFREASPLDNVKLPESVIEPVYFRAKFHGLIDDEMSMEELVDGITNYSTWQHNVENMLEALQEDPQPDAEQAFGNILGYLFAKAIEMTVNENKPVTDFKTRLTASYHPSEAFAGEISSTLSAEEHSVLEKSMEIGRQFFNDVAGYMKLSNAGEEQFVELFTQAAVVVQRIGQLYTDRCFETN